ncbi:MAG TPA: hypothetical protein VF258_01645, partial [Luteolibacter sp.]
CFIHCISDLVGLVGFVMFLGSLVAIPYRAITGTFHFGLWWYLVIGMGLAFVGLLLSAVTWTLARQRGFTFDSETRTASWTDQGQICTLHYSEIAKDRR